MTERQLVKLRMATDNAIDSIQKTRIGAVNWADLHCLQAAWVTTDEGETYAEVTIEEAAPGKVAGSEPARFLFPSRTTRSPRNHLSHEHEKALKACGLHFRIYDLRHSFASRLGEKGADAFVIAKILGHNDLRTVMKYVHLSDTRAKEVMQKFGQQPDELIAERIQ